MSSYGVITNEAWYIHVPVVINFAFLWLINIIRTGACIKICMCMLTIQINYLHLCKHCVYFGPCLFHAIILYCISPLQWCMPRIVGYMKGHYRRTDRQVPCNWPAAGIGINNTCLGWAYGHYLVALSCYIMCSRKKMNMRRLWSVRSVRTADILQTCWTYPGQRYIQLCWKFKNTLGARKYCDTVM